MPFGCVIVFQIQIAVQAKQEVKKELLIFGHEQLAALPKWLAQKVWHLSTLFQFQCVMIL